MNAKYQRFEFYSYRGDDKTELSRLYYGGLSPNPHGDLIEVPYCTYSDYSGSTVERSNCDVFLDQFSDLLGVSVWETYGDYGTRGVVILASLLDTNDEVKQVIEGLEDYPCIDEDNLSMLERELEDESWDSWLMWDVERELLKRQLCTQEDLDELEDEQIKTLFYAAMERANEYFFFEDPVSASIHIDRVLDRWEWDNN